MNALARYREVLLRDVDGLDTAALDWAPGGQGVGIGTSLLHIAAVEFLVTGAIGQSAGRVAFDGTGPWLALRPGFSRELGIAPSAGQSLSHYLGLLAGVRHASDAVLTDPWVPVDLAGALPGFLQRLGVGPQEQATLAAPLGLPLSVADGLEARDVVTAPIAHESYHRGQITQAKYLYRRSRAGA